MRPLKQNNSLKEVATQGEQRGSGLGLSGERPGPKHSKETSEFHAEGRSKELRQWPLTLMFVNVVGCLLLTHPLLSPSPHTIPPLIHRLPLPLSGSPLSHPSTNCSACFFFFPRTPSKYHHIQCCFDPTHALMRPPGVLAWQAEVLCQSLGFRLHSHSLLLLGPHHPLASLCSAASRLEAESEP